MNLSNIKFHKILKRFNDDRISEFAAEAAYFTILSFIPFTMLFVTLIKFTEISEENIFLLIKEFIPSNMYNFFLVIIDEIYSKSFSTISISALVAIWSSGKGFYSLCKGFRIIYRNQEKKSNFFIRVEGTLYTIFLMFSIIAVLILLVFGKRINYFLSKKFSYFCIVIVYVLKFRMIIILFILFITFWLIYIFTFKERTNNLKQIPGAIFSAFAWYITSYFFSIYIEVFKGFANLYGSLTTIILLMMWIYVCMYIILIGAEINMFCYDNEL